MADQTPASVSPEEMEKRVRICQRKLTNFISRMALDFGLIPVPVVVRQFADGVKEEVGTYTFHLATEQDIEVAIKIIEEADKRYYERKKK